MTASASSSSLPELVSGGQVLAEQLGDIGVITLNRANALNALSLGMVRDLTTLLLHWREDRSVSAVLVQGAGRAGKAPAFCAGGDIRFFHQAALAGNPQLEDFFTEEYALNHLIHRYPKPYIALMDGICMGGGMGISQGASVRVVTELSKLAMPETHIGLFPDVGGGWFLARCPGHTGEYLALTGQTLTAADAISLGLADALVPSAALPALVAALAQPSAVPGGPADIPHTTEEIATRIAAALKPHAQTAGEGSLAAHRSAIDLHFSLPTLAAIEASLASDDSEFAKATLATLHHRSPMMMAVTLELVRRARNMTLADDLRLERDLVRHCFQLRPGTASETVEGIRALAVDKDHHPHWNPPHIADVTPELIAPFFASPWPAHVHPLRELD
ncbi:enoyl-CoA hydratase/isomerase family protein [Ideonella azotifigens]|uniref:Enoyl-CoA hydratase/isomerase family protein n=1 Tax=Ideonella azotifigens TaxID=513160 RepID=A0ABN1K8E7_9BURK|nr:enoyl-CoA hydratase/isomerase family protein [Ideonella azotifigens]MCD2342893.1 enoyl-CoA hydratase/isomerase family protein [Ideonella azotifigens]